MGKLGISLYPEKTTLLDDKNYMQLAQKYGFSRIFMNLLLFNADQVDHIIPRLAETIEYGNKLGFETFLDVNPFTLKAIGIKPTELEYFSELGVKGIRLDMGFTGKEEAEMTKNRLGLAIEINMSNDDHYLERIFDYNPNKEQLVGCHNFFPQAYTGLDTSYFLHCSKRFMKKGLKTAAFVTSQVGKIGPWSLHEGLCTIEEHRNLPIEYQVKHMKSLQVIDDIIIGNAYASESELQRMSHAFDEDDWSFTINAGEALLPIEIEIIEKMTHSYRGDRSSYMIRSSKPRITYLKKSIPKRSNGVAIRRGDVLILNEEYGQYKGEVQIALKNRPGDIRINKVGTILEEELLLLDSIKPYTNFKLKLI